MRLRWILVPAGIGLVLTLRELLRAPRPELPPLQTAEAFDLSQYLGRWYEIARLPVGFEEGCAGVVAEYSLRPDGRIDVVNRCRAPEGPREARGVGSVPDPSHPERLEVSFFWPFGGQYWILAVGEGYRWAVVGEPERRTLWILSRTPELDAESRRAAVALAAAQGFDVARLIYTAQP